MSGGFPEWRLKHRAVLRLARRLDQHAVASLKMGRRILAKLHEIDDSIDIIAREIARQSKRMPGSSH